MNIKAEPLSLDVLCRKLKNKVVNPSPEYQRAYVWNEQMKSELVLSILEKHPIGSITLHQKDNKDLSIDSDYYWEAVDGQQRLITIWTFFDNQLSLNVETSKKIVKNFRDLFELAKNTNDSKIVKKFEKILKDFDNEKSFKLKFEDLPSRLNQRFIEYPIQITNILDADDNIIREHFRRVQNQEKLKAGEIMNSLPDTTIVEELRNITDDETLKQKLGFNNKRHDFIKYCINFVGINESKLNLNDPDKKILAYAEKDPVISQRTLDKISTLKELFLEIDELTDIKIKLNNTLIKLFLPFYAEYYHEMNEMYGLKKSLQLYERVMSRLSDFRPENFENFKENYSKFNEDLIKKYQNVALLARQSHNSIKVKLAVNNICDMIEFEYNSDKNLNSEGDKRQIEESQKRVILERDNWRCKMCSKELTLGTVEIDHIFPHAKNGPTEMNNLQSLCRDCNQKKKAKIEVNN